MKNQLFGLSLIVLLSSCSLLYRGLLGVDTTPEWMDSSELKKAIKKRELTEDLVLILDTASYTKEIKKTRFTILEKLGEDTSITNKRLQYKATKVANDDLQPAQVRLFTSQGTEIYKLVNCYIDQPIRSNWNVDNAFDSFPLYTADIVQNTHNYTLPFLLSHTTQLSEEKVKLADLPKSDYYLAVFWNSFTIRPSKKLITIVKEYIESHPEVTITPIYINNHNQQIWSQLDAAQRQIVWQHEAEMDKEEAENK